MNEYAYFVYKIQSDVNICRFRYGKFCRSTRDVME